MQLAEIAREHLPHAHLVDRVQLPHERHELTAPDHARQNGRELRVDADTLHEIGIRRQLRQGHIQNRRLHREHPGGDLLGRADRDGQLRLAGNAVVARRLIVGVQPRHGDAAAPGRQLRDDVAAHGVDGRGREHQIGAQHRPHAGTDVRRAAGLFELLLEILLRERAVDCWLRHGAGGLADVAVRVLHGELRRAAGLEDRIKFHADALGFALLIGRAGGGEEG